VTYDCMTPEELALWRMKLTYAPALSPCIDCPLSFHLAEKAAGRCHRDGPYRLPVSRRPRGTRGPAPVYVTEAERRAARRDTWRASKRRQRAVHS